MNAITKKIILGIFTVACGVLFWWYVERTLFQDPDSVTRHFWSLGALGLFSLLLVLYAVMLSLVAFVVPSRLWAQCIMLAGASPYLMMAPMGSYEIGAAFGVLWGALALMREWVWKENGSRLELSVDKAVTPNMSWAFTAIAIAVAASFYVSPAVLQLKDIRIPRELFQAVVSPLELAFVQRVEQTAMEFMGNFNGGGTVKEIKIDALSPEQQQAIERIARPFTQSPEKQGRYSEFSDALYDAINNRIAAIAQISPDAERILSFSLAVALFASIRLAAIPIGWVVIVIVMLLFNVLSYVGFVKTGSVQVEKETIDL